MRLLKDEIAHSVDENVGLFLKKNKSKAMTPALIAKAISKFDSAKEKEKFIREFINAYAQKIDGDIKHFQETNESLHTQERWNERNSFFSRLLKNSASDSGLTKIEKHKNELTLIHKTLFKIARENGWITQIDTHADVMHLWLGRLSEKYKGDPKNKIKFLLRAMGPIKQNEALGKIQNRYGGNLNMHRSMKNLEYYVRSNLKDAENKYREYMANDGSNELFKSYGLSLCVYLPEFIHE